MPFDLSERVLIRIIISCLLAITYLLGVKFYEDYFIKYAENRVLFIERGAIPIIQRKSNVKDLGIDDQQKRELRDKSKRKISTSSAKEWIYHKEKVHFVHPEIALRPVPNGNIEEDITVSKPGRSGIFASNHIPFGTILSVEDPIFSSLSFVNQPEPQNWWLRLSWIDRIVKDHIKRDLEFKKVWKSLPVHAEQRKRLLQMLESTDEMHHQSAVDNYVRFATHKIASHKKPWALYSVIGRLGFNLPQNAMVVIGDNDRALLISTKAIEKGEEIVTDHFGDWLNSRLFETEKFNARKVWAGDRGFDLNQKWIAFLMRLRDESLSTVQKHEMILELYPNGLIGKEADLKFHTEFALIAGCKRMKSQDCDKKTVLTRIIEAGDIFYGFDVQSWNNDLKDMEARRLDNALVPTVTS